MYNSDGSNIIRMPKNKKNLRHEEVVNLVIERAKEAIVCIIKLEVASEKLFSDELPLQQLRIMENNMTKLLTIAEKDLEGEF